MLPAEKLNRINELARKAKAQGLTVEEQKERHELRQEYLKAFRGDMLTHLKSMKIVDEKGKDVTPEKLKLLKAEGNGLVN
ncbi:DUF896 domain-containing protein [Ectobacillus antri]|jgi:uncharacterized protein YnzC (UPF0291/DUF896 family)|uniref:UPF0291 protein P6P90_01520 n=1 Tax=Ectobacillus antri TaxID=2486280 RepID=A0ABT6H2K7_9BACI|nr:DUF896 domain-containing protein [Ectobacillus antri]MDG4656006.1 DUF896 domain-containing protein [Ectobacillus antri]MDG5752681.1 DUF896 domain-containing protein [Ectobacillus antri]